MELLRKKIIFLCFLDKHGAKRMGEHSSPPNHSCLNFLPENQSKETKLKQTDQSINRVVVSVFDGKKKAAIAFPEK